MENDAMTHKIKKKRILWELLYHQKGEDENYFAKIKENI